MTTAIVREEVARLPEKYRSPIVLCYLEGLTHEGAAEQLGWPVGTVRGRLARARDLLRTRLTRRGVAGSTALAALPETADAAVPRALRQTTLAAATRLASGQPLVVAAGPRAASLAIRAGHASGYIRMGLVTGLVALGMGLAAVPGGKPGQEPPKDSRELPPASRGERSANLRAMLQLKGTWTSPQTETSHINGVPQPPKHYKLIWSIERDRITTSGPDGFAEHTYRFSVDPDRNPPEIDLTSLNKGIALRGIYELKGDRLTVCYGLERPRRLEEGPKHFRIVFDREGRAPASLAPELPNAPGCYWSMEPKGGIPSSCPAGASA